MTSKVGLAHKISRALTRAVYLAPPLSQSWIRPCMYNHVFSTLASSSASTTRALSVQNPPQECILAITEKLNNTT